MENSCSQGEKILSLTVLLKTPPSPLPNFRVITQKSLCTNHHQAACLLHPDETIPPEMGEISDILYSNHRRNYQRKGKSTGLHRSDWAGEERWEEKEREYDFLDSICVLPLEGNLKQFSVRIFPLACGTLGFPDVDSEEKYIHY